MKITVSQIMQWGPCEEYTEEKIRKFIGNGKTPLEIAAMERIPAADRIWCLLHKEIISERGLYELACTFAERVLIREREKGREPDVRSWEAIEAKRKWLRGEITDRELAAASAAASAAVYAIECKAAYLAANVAACAAVYAAERAAARAAVSAAVYAATEERKEQLEIIVEKIKQEGR